MPFADDPTLAARPDQFELVSSPQAARAFRVLAVSTFVMGLVVLGIAVLNHITVLAVVAAIMGIGAPVMMLNMAKNARAWRLRDGRRLNTSSSALREPTEAAWTRLSTGDPAQYTPLKLGSSGDSSTTLSFFWPDDEPVTYAVIARGRGKSATVSEIIELRDAEHDALHAARRRGLHRPYVG